MKPIRTATDAKTRFRVFERDRFTCQYCGEHAPHVKLEMDHVVPVAKGGKTEFDNLTTSCQDCNAGKGDMLISHRSVPLEELAVRAMRVVEKEQQEHIDDQPQATLTDDIIRKHRLRRKEAAAYISLVHGIPCASSTLAKLACVGGGPAYSKIGRYPLCTKASLDSWVAERITPEILNTSMHVNRQRHIL